MSYSVAFQKARREIEREADRWLAEVEGRPKPPGTFRLRSLDAVVREHLYWTLAACDGNKMKAARILGRNVKTVYNLLEKYRIE